MKRSEIEHDQKTSRADGEWAEEAVAIFDLDGVIVDTIPSLYQGYLDILESFGVAGSREEFERLNGSNLDEIVAFLAREHSLHGREQAIRDGFETSFRQLYTHIDLMPGVVETLERLRAEGVSLCLASSAARGPIEEVLTRFDLGRFFEHVVSGDDVERAKPDPEIYRLAKGPYANRHGFVVEDSRNGIRAALGAGLVAIQLDPSGAFPMREACYTVRELSQVPNIVLEQEAVVLARAEHIELVGGGEGPSFAAETEQKAGEIWREALAERPSLFDGRVATYRSHETEPGGRLCIHCCSSRYRFVFARLQDRSLPLPAPIGVSAVVVDGAGRVLLGKRSDQVSEYRGCFELVPSGGIPVEKMHSTRYLEQVGIELTEETGMASARIESLEPLGLVYDRIHGVYDVCVRIRIDASVAPETLISTEYDGFLWLDPDSWEGRADRQPLIPTSEAILRFLREERHPSWMTGFPFLARGGPAR